MKKIVNYKVLNLTSSPNCTFKAFVIVDGKTREFILTTRYREVCKYWTMDIKDASGKDILVNIPLLNSENILEPFEYLGIGGAMMVDLYRTGNTAANEKELGQSVKMIWGSLE